MQKNFDPRVQNQPRQSYPEIKCSLKSTALQKNPCGSEKPYRRVHLSRSLREAPQTLRRQRQLPPIQARAETDAEYRYVSNSTRTPGFVPGALPVVSLENRDESRTEEARQNKRTSPP